jgi:hypothetical protein
MPCAAPQQVDCCVGLFQVNPNDYQCPYCVSTASRAAKFGKRVQTDRQRINEFMKNPVYQAKFLASNPLAIDNRMDASRQPRSEKERKGWEKCLSKYLKNPDSVNLIGRLAQKQWSDMVEVVLVELFTLQFALGIAPCKFAVVVSGSLARRESCPYSDVECFILIESEFQKDAKFFKDGSEHINSIMGWSGEGLRGLGFDEELCPMKHVFTPREMKYFLYEAIEIGKKDDPGRSLAKRGVLTDVRFIYGTEDLFNEFIKCITELKTSWVNTEPKDVLAAWKNEFVKLYTDETMTKINKYNADQRPYLKSKSGRVDLKRQYYRWLEQIPRFMCEYYGLEAMGARKQVKALRQAKHISDPIATYVLDALDAVANLRVKLQLETEYQAHHVLKAPPPPNTSQTFSHGPTFAQNQQTGKWEKTEAAKLHHVLNAKEKDDLDRIHKTVHLMIRKSLEFFDWAPTADTTPPVKASPNPLTGVKLIFKNIAKPSPSPFMDQNPNLDVPDF